MDNRFTEDDAVLYVLGEMPEAERRRFESDLERSPGLRTIVRDLEAGAAALAHGLPRHRPPREVWSGIEMKISSGSAHRGLALRVLAWLRNGWAVACLAALGWLLYAFWDPPANSRVARETSVPRVNTHPRDPGQAVPVVVPKEQTVAESSTHTGLKEDDSELSLKARGQIATLQRHVADLELQVARLSHAVLQQQAILSQPGHAALFPLVSAADTGIGQSTVLQPTPQMQRALFLAIARQFGSDPRASGENDKTDDLGVDFADILDKGQVQVLPGGLRDEEQFKTQLEQPGDLPPGTETAQADSTDIIGAVLETNIVLVLNTTTLKSFGSDATLVAAGQGGLETLGTVPFGDHGNPLVIRFASNLAAGNAWGVQIGNTFYSRPAGAGPGPVSSTNTPP
jgi:hypothetical protein